MLNKRSIRFTAEILLIVLLIPLIQGATYVIDPVKNAVRHNERGLFFLSNGNYAGAIQEYEIAISLNPDTQASASFYNNLGLVYHRLEAYNTALEYFQKSVNLDPAFLMYYQNLINVYFAQKTSDKIEKHYEKLIEKDRYNSSAYLMAGLINKKSGNKAAAIMYLSEYARLEPDLNLTVQIKIMLRELR